MVVDEAELLAERDTSAVGEQFDGRPAGMREVEPGPVARRSSSDSNVEAVMERASVGASDGVGDIEE